MMISRTYNAALVKFAYFGPYTINGIQRRLILNFIFISSSYSFTFLNFNKSILLESNECMQIISIAEFLKTKSYRRNIFFFIRYENIMHKKLLFNNLITNRI